MKKFKSSLLIMLLVVSTAMAQQTANQKDIRQEVAEDVPLAVLSAVEKNNLGFQFQKESPVTAAKESRVVSPKTEKFKRDFLVTTRSSSLNGRSHKKERAFYQADGSFVSSKTIKKNFALPQRVLNTIGKEYNGWLLVKTKTVVEEKGDVSTVYYKAVLQNGKRRENILLNRAGQIVKNKRDLKKNALKAGDQIVLK